MSSYQAPPNDEEQQGVEDLRRSIAAEYLQPYNQVAAPPQEPTQYHDDYSLRQTHRNLYNNTASYNHGNQFHRHTQVNNPQEQEQQGVTEEFLRKFEELKISDTDTDGTRVSKTYGRMVHHPPGLIGYHDGKTRREDLNQYNIMASYNQDQVAAPAPPQVVPPLQVSTHYMEDVIPLMENKLDSMRTTRCCQGLACLPCPWNSLFGRHARIWV